MTIEAITKRGKPVKRIRNVIVQTWFINTPDDEKIIHFGEIPLGGEMQTGQKNTEEFTTETAYFSRLTGLGVPEKDQKPENRFAVQEQIKGG